MADVPFMKGEHCLLQFYFNGAKVILNAKNWNVRVNVTKIADGVGGENRDRLDVSVNYFEFTANCFNRNTALLDAYLADQANNDTGVAPLDKGAGITVKPRDGSKKAYVAKEMCMDDFDLTMGGRVDRVMNQIGFRSRYFTPVQAA